MGHDIRTHNKYYRLPDEVVELCKLTKFFSLLEDGKIPQMQGKNLDELPLPDEEMEYGSKFKMRT